MKAYTFPPILICGILISCTSPKEKAIAEFVETSGNVRTHMNVKVHELTQTGWITGKDSLSLIQEDVKRKKLEILDEMAKAYRPNKAYKDVWKKIEAGYKGITPELDSLFELERVYSGVLDMKLLPIYQCKYSYSIQGQRSTATANFVFDKSENKVLAML